MYSRVPSLCGTIDDCSLLVAGPLQEYPELWLEALKVLQAASILPANSTAGRDWSKIAVPEMVNLWSNVTQGAKHTKVQLYGLERLVEIATGLATSAAAGQHSSTGKGNGQPQLQGIGDAMASLNISPQSKVRTGCEAATFSEAIRAQSAALDAALTLADAENPTLRAAAGQAVIALIGASHASAAQSRDASAASPATTMCHATPAIITGDQIASVCQVGCDRLSDSSPGAAGLWFRVVLALSPHLARLPTSAWTLSPVAASALSKVV